MSIKYGNTAINKIYYGSTEIKKAYYGSTVIFDAISEVLGTPILTNFRVENAQPTRVVFDASASVAGMTTTGFTISGKTISSITIDGDGLGGYFTVSVAFDFWDNNTIELDGGNGTVYDFTRVKITNNINEPNFAGADIDVDASGGGDHTTIQAGINAASTGDKVWVKKGNYSETITSVPSGIKIEGYDTVFGDITTNYLYDGYSDTTTLSSTEMPLVTAPTPGSGTGLSFVGDSGIIVRNLQFQRFDFGITHSNCSNIQLERVNVYLCDIGGIDATDRNNNNLRWLQCESYCSFRCGRPYGDYHLIEDC